MPTSSAQPRSTGQPARLATLNTLFTLRREPYYHKLQYSKTPKFDVAAAVFGAIISAFFGYLTLSTLGSAGADLADMTALCWYLFVSYKISWYLSYLAKNSVNFFLNPVTLAC
jgi:hypothetical protein